MPIYEVDVWRTVTEMCVVEQEAETMGQAKSIVAKSLDKKQLECYWHRTGERYEIDWVRRKATE